MQMPSIRSLGKTNTGNRTSDARTSNGTKSFADVLKNQVKADGSVKFSKHANERLESRNIHLDKAQLGRLDESIKIAKSKGAKIAPKIESELFSEEGQVESLLKNDLLKTKEDYVKYESVIVDGYRWLMETPVDKYEENRRAVSMFILQWIAGSSKVSVKLSEKIVTYGDCPECVMIFMSSWANYVLKTKDNNEFKGTMEGTKSVIQFYKKNKKLLGKNEAIEKYIELQNSNKLEEYIKSNL